MTTTHMPHLAAIAREGDERAMFEAAWHFGYAEAIRAHRSEDAGPVRFPTCPPWCNDHLVVVDDEPDQCASDHQMTVQGDGWAFSIAENHHEDRVAPVEWMPTGATIEQLSLSDARAYARAILAACDAVEGPR